MTMGSVHYFSPEQARGENVTGASDVYSAGLVLFEMLTGCAPFGGDTAAAVAMARLTGQRARPRRWSARTCPPALDAIVRWALPPDPRARPTATELSMALGRFLADPYGHVRLRGVQAATRRSRAALCPPSPPPAAARAADGWCAMRWVRLAAALGGLFVLVLGGVLDLPRSSAGAPGGTRAATPSPVNRPRPPW